MDQASEGLPSLPVELLAFSANPDPYIEAARREHPWAFDPAPAPA